MRGLKPFRVRVRQTSEVWLDINAPSADLAEKAAAGKPGVVSVFPGSAISAEKPVRPGEFQPAIVEEEPEE